MTDEDYTKIAIGILRTTGFRVIKTECPSTLFDHGNGTICAYTAKAKNFGSGFDHIEAKMDDCFKRIGCKAGWHIEGYKRDDVTILFYKVIKKNVTSSITVFNFCFELVVDDGTGFIP